MRSFVSRNPTTGQLIKEFPFISDSALHDTINKSYAAFEFNKKSVSLKQRADKLVKLADLIDQNVEKYGKILTTEMGKTITSAMAEVKKSSGCARYYAENLDKYYRPDRVKTEVTKTMVLYQPFGPIYHIAPFNFPFWLAFKALMPGILLGNTYIARNSDSTPLTALAIEELFKEAGFDSGEFINVFSRPDQADLILGHDKVRGLSFTGSSRAGGILGSIAAKYCKKSVMELGGNDGFLVLKDADIEAASSLAISGRLQNCGQVCIAAKRMIVHQDIYEKFRDAVLRKIHDVKIGDPMKPETQMGPMSRLDLLENIHNQVHRAVQGGAKLLAGGKRLTGGDYDKGYFYQPTVLEMDQSNPLADEELFGPVFSFYKAKDDADIVRICNNTKYGLGCIIASTNNDHAEQIAAQIDAGMVFVNDLTRGDYRVPFGGFKYSGYGRDLGHHGVHEFANIKTVWIK